MKMILKLLCLTLFCLIVSIASCTKENFYRGIYETTTQEHTIKQDRSGLVVKEDPPSYGQYQLDRKEMIEKQTE